MYTELKIDEKFKEYVTEDHEDNKLHYIFRFPNNFGASVVKGRGTYGEEEDMWELALTKYPDYWMPNKDRFQIVYYDIVGGDVLGWLDDERVNELLEQIAKGDIGREWIGGEDPRVVDCEKRMVMKDQDIRDVYDLWKEDGVPEELRDKLYNALYDLHNWYHYTKGY